MVDEVSAKSFCHQNLISSLLLFIKYISIANLQSNPSLPKHILYPFLPCLEIYLNLILYVSVGDNGVYSAGMSYQGGTCVAVSFVLCLVLFNFNISVCPIYLIQ